MLFSISSMFSINWLGKVEHYINHWPALDSGQGRRFLFVRKRFLICRHSDAQPQPFRLELSGAWGARRRGRGGAKGNIPPPQTTEQNISATLSKAADISDKIGRAHV